MFIFSFATLPNPATLLSDIGQWSAPLFTDLLPIAEFIVGFAIGGAIIALLINGAVSAVRRLTH